MPGALVLADLADAPDVARIMRKRSGEEELDEPSCVVLGVVSGADRDDVGVVVLSGQPGGLVPAARVHKVTGNYT